MQTDMQTANYIGQQAKAIMQLIADIDPYMPDEDMVEVLIGRINAWVAVQTQLLFPVLEAIAEENQEITAAAQKRLEALYVLQNDIHTGEGADEPFTELAIKYIDAVKYHLLADVQIIIPLAARLPQPADGELAAKMAAMQTDLV